MTEKEQTFKARAWLKGLEYLLFEFRTIVLLIFAVLTIVFLYNALKLRPEASFLRMIPTYHPYIKNYLQHEDDLKGLGNYIRIAVETTEGEIYTKDYLTTLQKIHDEVFYIPGVDRVGMMSLWAPMFRWREVTAEGYIGGAVIMPDYDGSKESIEEVRQNVLKSGKVGELVANNFKSSIIHVPIYEKNPETGQPLDYHAFSQKLEEVRDKFQNNNIKIHITGFAKVVGDLIEGSGLILVFFVVTFFILLSFLYLTSRCWRSTIVRATSSLVAVAWQLGVMRLFGYGLNPYSMLVPFLMFALGVSHGIQMGNAMTREMMHGADKLTASRSAFRMIFVPGFAALITDAVGFALLFVIKIGVIQDIAIGATIGVIVVAFTDLMLLPVMMSFTGVSEKAIKRLADQEKIKEHPFWFNLAKISSLKSTTVIIIVTVLILGTSFYGRQGLQIGDLDPGAPELRVDSRYNKDVAFMDTNYSVGNDLLVIMLNTPGNGNTNYNVLVAADRLQLRLGKLEGVKSVYSLVNNMKLFNVAFSEGNYKWFALPRSSTARKSIETNSPFRLRNMEGTVSPIYVYLKDHKAKTLADVVDVVEAFNAEYASEKGRFLLAAGNAGIEAATNIEIEKSQNLMTILVFTVISLVCLITYRSVRGTLCIVIPLYVTMIMSEALMAKLGIGVKVATLPVIAVGVGIGVDYGIYIYSKLSFYLSEGRIFFDAYYRTLTTTGRAVLFTGTTLAIGVGTWMFSPIKFQADMGLLLAFVFLGNMFGALLLQPALFTLLGVTRKHRRLATEKDKDMLQTSKELQFEGKMV